MANWGGIVIATDEGIHGGGPADRRIPVSGCSRCHGIAKGVENSSGASALGLRPAVFPRIKQPPPKSDEEPFSEK
jgi:hypothetical protein